MDQKQTDNQQTNKHKTTPRKHDIDRKFTNKYSAYLLAAVSLARESASCKLWYN